MPGIYEKIQNEESTLKVRIYSLFAFESSFLFYYLMGTIAPKHVDWFSGRIIIALLSIIIFICSFIESISFTTKRLFIIFLSQAYILLYIYLLQLNAWSVFHRWSYFVVISIITTSVFTWRDYVFAATTALVLPIIVGFFSPLSSLELIHFHTTNLVTLAVIGIAIRSNFKYRQQVIKLTNNLAQNSKMVALGEMSAGLSHEINNPLAIITTSADQLEFGMENPNENKEMIQISTERILRASKRIARIIQGLHDFSQGDSNEFPQRLNVQNLIDDAINLCSERFKSKGIELLQEIPTSEIFCFGQRAQLTQLLINILNNAFDAVVVTASPQIRIKVLVQDDTIFISVLDNGPGVPAQIESRIMQPFFTTKPTGQGTGLGLSISLGIARSNRGDLYLDRSQGNSCFTIQLPQIIA